jgi:hypothetical protein
MNLLTQLEQDRAEFARNIEAALFHARNFADALNRASSVWSLSDDRLGPLLASLGAERISQLAALVGEQGVGGALNQGMVALGGTASVQTQPGREFTIDPQTGAVALVPLPEPSPEP